MRLKLFLIGLCALPCSLFADLHYIVRPDVGKGSINVEIDLDTAADTLQFKLPAWDPGYYLILHNEAKIHGFVATDPDGHQLKAQHSELRTWTVFNPQSTPVTVHYDVMGDDAGYGFFAVHMDEETGFINGPAAFMYVDSRKDERDTLKVELPEGWDIATAMDPTADDAYSASNYDEFIDHPLQIGHFTRVPFQVQGIPFEAVFVSTQSITCDPKVEAARLQILSAPAIRLFGKEGFKRYLFIVHLAVGAFNGGLEHRASDVLAIANSPSLNIDTLATHEYFHAWNVKQIRPKILGPFDYSQEVYTDNLWFAEGVTDYYAYVTAYRSGLHDVSWLLRSMSDQIYELHQSKNRFRVTLSECSRRAWENGGMGVGDLSYYNKGYVAGLLFDAAIRAKTSGEKSLDDVMRYLYAKHHLPNPGYEEDGILKAMNDVSGHDLSSIYHRIVDSTDEMPYSLLSGIGLRLSGQTVVADSATTFEARARLNEWLKRP